MSTGARGDRRDYGLDLGLDQGVGDGADDGHFEYALAELDERTQREKPFSALEQRNILELGLELVGRQEEPVLDESGSDGGDQGDQEERRHDGGHIEHGLFPELEDCRAVDGQRVGLGNKPAEGVSQVAHRHGRQHDQDGPGEQHEPSVDLA